MTKNKKILLGVGAVALIYWVYTRNKAGKSLNPFAKSSSFAGGDDFFKFDGDDDFFNAVDPRQVRFKTTSAGCQVYQGQCNASVGTIIDGNKIIVSNSPNCVVCPKSNTPTGMPVRG
jgi:hypothetical protein